jgi:transposase-like protein
MAEPKTLLEAVRHFTNLDVCNQYMIDLKWPDGRIVCPECGCDRIGNIASRRMLQCKAPECRKQFSAKVGTIFEGSPLGLDKWFVAVWSIANAKNGVSSHELARALGITQKSAWFVLHRIRMAMETPTHRKLNGEVGPN